MSMQFFTPLFHEINIHAVTTQSWSMWGEG